jgi:ketosteroid isomerase-like protein
MVNDKEAPMNPDPITYFIDALHHGFLQGDELAANKQQEARNVAVLQEVFRAIQRGDFMGLTSFFDDDIELDIVGPEAIPIVGRWRGPQKVAEAARRNFGMLEEQHPEVLSVVAQGDTVVIGGRERGRYQPTGRCYDVHFVYFMTLRDGKIVRVHEVFDSAPMLEAVQVQPRRKLKEVPA